MALREQYHRIFALIVFMFMPAVVQQVTIFGGNYWIGFVGKIITHVVVPVFLVALFDQTNLPQSFLAPIRIDRRKLNSSLLVGLWLGGLAVVILFGAYGFFVQWLDIDGIIEHLNGDFLVNASTYPLVALGIVLTTPFFEEYFWRGWLYRSASNLAKTKKQHQLVLWLTGLAFAVHHVVIFWSWFNWWQLLLATTFLALVGVLFNYLFKSWQSILPGLITHTLADVAIVLIGFHLLF